jgi:hypothetical protein
MGEFMLMKLRLFAAIATVIFCTGSPDSLRAQGIDYTVGVHYYPWYAGDFHGGQYLREQLIPAQLPVLGEYDDRENPIISAHLDWSRRAGVDFWSASWWGPQSREDITLQEHVLPHPELGDFRIAIHYETAGRTDGFSDYSRIGTDFSYLAEHYFGHPNYLKIEGKPVVIVYLTRVLSSLGTLQSSLAAMRDAADAAGYGLYVMGDQVFGWAPPVPGDIALLDGIMNYDVYGSMGASGYAGQGMVDAYYTVQANWKALADSVGTDYAPAVTPGFNDRAVREGHNAVSRKLAADDGFGSLFRAMLLEARQLTDPDIGHMILVTSWNEWHEDTQIEPVCPADSTSLDDSGSGTELTQGLEYEGYGTRYLEILQEETSQTIYSDGFEARDTSGFVCALNGIDRPTHSRPSVIMARRIIKGTP